jgi:putative ABC transport system ATP-binding protein
MASAMQDSTVEAEPVAISMRSLNKVYQLGDAKVEVLKDVNLDVFPGEFIAICGASGAGKTTLLNLVGGIDKPTSGIIRVFDEDLTEKAENELSEFRSTKVGFVFQAYNLVSTLTVAENIAFPMEWTGKPAGEIEARISELLSSLGLQHRQNHFPAQLSGGEQQRVAFARALANDPPLLLADEPTGNLDAVNAQKIVEILGMLKNEGKTVIVSTHDERIVQLAKRTFCLEDGKLATGHA